MFENVKPLLQWFDSLERRIKALEAEVKGLNDEALIRGFEESVAGLAKAPAPRAASKPPLTVGLSNIPRRSPKRGRRARA